MDIKTNRFTSIEQVTGQFLSGQQVKSEGATSDISFDKVLAQRFDEVNRPAALKFSKHAAQRLEQRNIVLTNEQLDRLEQGAIRSEAKGIKESLVIMDEYAFIVNTRSNTVVTAMQTDHEGENIYTNIDGAVLV